MELKYIAVAIGLTISVGLAGCSTALPKSEPEKISMSIVELPVRNDIGSSPGQPLGGGQVVADGLMRSHSTGVLYAIECKEHRVDCRHAVVLPRLDMAVSKLDGDRVEISGVVNIKYGRKLTQHIETGVHTAPSAVYEQTKSVPNEVPVIEEGEVNLPFKQLLKKGEVYKVSGFENAGFEIRYN